MKIISIFLQTSTLRALKAILAAVSLSLLFGACYTPPVLLNNYFTVDADSPKIEVGTFEAQFDKTISLMGIKKETVNVEYYPLEDAVCLQYRIEFYTYNQFWNRRARAAFVRSLEAYKEDYAAKTFGKSNKASKQKYGKVNSYLIWQMFQYTIKAKAPNIVEMGYYFKNNAPYFVLNQKEAKYEDPMSRDNNRTALDTMIYFTRAQADDLAALFDQELLDGLTAAKAGTYTRDPSPDAEKY